VIVSDDITESEFACVPWHASVVLARWPWGKVFTASLWSTRKWEESVRPATQTSELICAGRGFCSQKIFFFQYVCMHLS